MPDTKGLDTHFADYVAGKMPFKVVETLGTDPAAQINSSDAGVTGRVSPAELPMNDLDFGASK